MTDWETQRERIAAYKNKQRENLPRAKAWAQYKGNRVWVTFFSETNEWAIAARSPQARAMQIRCNELSNFEREEK